MTQVYAVAGIIILVCVMICYLFVRQTIIKRKKEKMRLKRALNKRANDLVQMHNAFPPHFLPKDLQMLLYRCIIDVYEQLNKLEPEESDYLENFTLYTSHMESAARITESTTEITLQNSSQINELRQYLNYLGRFIQKWMERGNITSKQYAHYKAQLKQVICKLTVDNYTVSAKAAVSAGKTKLAIHYYTLSKSLIKKEGLVAQNKNKVISINQELERLEEMVRAEELRQAELANAKVKEHGVEQPSAEQDQWDKFSEGDDEWKKKNIYD